MAVGLAGLQMSRPAKTQRASRARAEVTHIRTLPHGPDQWQMRWRGSADALVDGQPVQPTAQGEEWVLDLDARAPHTVQIGAIHAPLSIPARPADPCSPLRLVALGDGRAGIDGIGPSAHWRALLIEALGVRPDFILNTGDLVKRGADPHEWDRYLETLPAWPPIIPVRGNHDRGPWMAKLGQDLTDQSGVFAWPVGPVWLVGVDTEVGEDGDGAAIAEALEAALKRGGDRWRVVMTHRPIWSRGPHGSDERGWNRWLVPALDRGGAHLVLSGHDHDYERLCASTGLGADRRCGAGPTYVITGGAATWTAPWPGLSRKVPDEVAEADAQASLAFSGSHHFVRLDISADRIEGLAWRTRAGNVRPPGPIDRFVLTRARPTECAARPDAGPP